jgi:hypothetical protein
MTTITFEHPTLIQGKRNNIDGGVFDAWLDTGTSNAKDNAELTILMRVHFFDGYHDASITKGGKAKDADKNEFKAFPWKDTDFVDWKKRLVATARKFWHGKFWLQTPSHYKGLDWPRLKSTHRPNVWCRFELEEAPAKEGAHFSIACINLGKEGKVKGTFFRSHMFLYDSNDPLNTKRHEVGHLLGLDHPQGNSNNSAAYADKPGKAGDVMGSGNNIYDHHARPWQKAISLITDTKLNDWKVFMKQKIFPKKLI